jgi:hypothetical protein
MTCRQTATTVFLLFFSAAQAYAAELQDISNYREYSPLFSSSGQPTKKQLDVLHDNGFERIVYIAFTNSGNAFADEDQIVKKSGWIMQIRSIGRIRPAGILCVRRFDANRAKNDSAALPGQLSRLGIQFSIGSSMRACLWWMPNAT